MQLYTYLRKDVITNCVQFILNLDTLYLGYNESYYAAMLP